MQRQKRATEPSKWLDIQTIPTTTGIPQSFGDVMAGDDDRSQVKGNTGKKSI